MARPQKNPDWKLVDNLCAIHCTGEEIAAMVGISYDTLNLACKREHNCGFTDYFLQKSAGGKASLRRKQYTTAMGVDGDDTRDPIAPNPTMLIWLGKQWLGQGDKQAVDLTSSDGSMMPKPGIDLSKAPPELLEWIVAQNDAADHK